MRSVQRGFTLIEMLAALMVAAMLLVGVTAMINTSLEDTKAQQAAEYQNVFATAASKYIKEKYSTLQAGGDATVAIDGLNPGSPTFRPEFANLLPSGMRLANGYGQTPCLLVRARTIPGRSVRAIDALVVMEGTDARAIPSGVLPFAAAHAGIGGGFITSAVGGPIYALGASGAWHLDDSTTPTVQEFVNTKCTADSTWKAGVGSLVSALFFDGPGTAPEFLYRSHTDGFEELNTMKTPLLMAEGAVNNALGSSCGSVDGAAGVAAIGFDGNRNLMFCDTDQKWKRVAGSWRQPKEFLSELADLKPGDLEGTMPGDVRMLTKSGRAYTYTNDSGWIPVSLDEDGNMNVPRKLTVDQTVTSGGTLTVLNGGIAVNDGGVLVKGGGVEVTAGSVVVDEGDLDLRAGNVWAKSGVIFTKEITLMEQHAKDEECNKEEREGGEVLSIKNPLGTVAVDAASSIVVCTGTGPGDSTFQYPTSAP